MHAQPNRQQFSVPGYQQVAIRAAEFPDCKIILDHCGWMSGATPSTVDPVLALAQYPNVYAKITFGQPKGGTQTPGPVPWPRADSPVLAPAVRMNAGHGTSPTSARPHAPQPAESSSGVF